MPKKILQGKINVLCVRFYSIIDTRTLSIATLQGERNLACARFTSSIKTSILPTTKVHAKKKTHWK